MDRRTSFLCLVPLVVGAVGCATTTAIDGIPAASADRQQQVRLLAAAADCAAHRANNSTIPPAEQQEMRERARKSYEQVLAMSPKNLQALTGLARLYATTGDQGETVTAYQRAIEAAPKDAELRYELGMYHARNKEWDAAIAVLQAARDLEPKNHKFDKTLGFTLARCGRWDESLACFQAAGMTDAEAHLKLARMLHHLQHDELARQHLELAQDQSRNEQDLREARELQGQLDGEDSNAVGTSNESLDLEP